MSKITIAYAPDDGYINMTVVSMFSAVQNNIDSNIEFIILYSNLKEESINKLNSIKSQFDCNIRYVKIDESEFNDFPMSKWVTVQAWFRIKIPDLCPDLDKVLYLDCDTMVNQPLKELFEIDLKDNYIAAVKDVWDVDKHLRRLSMNSDSYFNSGVMLINCQLWREHKLFNKIKEYAIENKKIIKFCDQDSLNKVIDDKKINLHQKFNFMDTWWRNYYNQYEGNDLRNYEEAQKNPVIVHLTGPKPDMKGCANSMCEKWWYYTRLTDVYLEETEKFKNSKDPNKNKKLLSKIFNIKNEYRNKDKWKVFTILGVKIKFRLEYDEKIFLVFNTAFIGDILLNNALVQNIKYFYPHAKVVYIVQPQFEDIAKYQKDVDDVVTFNKRKYNNLFGLIKFIKDFPYKNIFASFVLYSNDRNIILARMLKSKHIMTEPHGLLQKILSTKEKYSRNTYIHKKDIATGLIESLTGKAILDIPIKYEVPDIDTDVIQQVKSINKEIIALTTTSKFKPKDMPPEDAVELINMINQSGRCPIILGAGETAQNYINELNKLGCNNYVNLVDKTNFIELANILKISKALISVDTGTMHMGNALNVPTIAVFYSGWKEMWAPQEGLYKAIVLSDNPKVEEIYKALDKV